MKKIAALVLSLGFGLVASAQVVTLTGVVLDSANQPIVGAFVVEQGTNNGTMSGVAGEFTLSTRPGAAVEVSCIGYTTQMITNTGVPVTVILPDDTEMLEETVVIGYGVQKKSVVTAAISSITSDDLKATAQTRVDNVLQGMTSGVTVTQTSGSPTAGAQVRVRGVGSINNSEPLYIVDGMPSGGIDYLNPNDIERIEVLKDAASGAVYGARAANGVVLITTKKGAKGKAKVAYDFSYGFQNPWRKPAVLNATEYAIMMNEGRVNSGQLPQFSDPYSYGKGTDWVDAIFDKDAPVMKHDLSVSGGSDKVDYAVSAGYLSRDGIIGSRYDRSFYDRFTLRENVGVILFDHADQRDYLNKLDFRTNVSFTHIKSADITTNSEYGSPLGSALAMSPIEPIYATDAMVEEYKSLTVNNINVFPYLLRDRDGRYFSVANGAVYNEQVNPLADLSRPGYVSETNKVVAGLNAGLQLYKGLKFRSSVTGELTYVDNHGYNDQYFLSSFGGKYSLDTVTSTVTYDKDGNEIVTDKLQYGSYAQQSTTKYVTWQVENVLSYDRQFGRHTVNAILGQSAFQSYSANVGAGANGLQFPYDEWKISVNNTYGKQADGDRNGWGSWNSIVYSMISYFGRVSYNYDERYMAEATIRRDASSHFGPGNKWGTFPSFSVGWNVRNESFMQDFDVFSTLKVRASWGINGNDSIGDFRYAVYSASGNNYAFGSGASGTESISSGTKPNGLANPDIKWEQSIQTDLGVDLGFFQNRLTATVDFYDKKTSGMLLELPVVAYAGDSSPIGNLGDMVNRGVEFDLGYRNHVGDFYYKASLNATYNRNKLTYLGDDATSLYGSNHKIGQLTRGIVGEVFPYFYGYKTDGIFQNVDEVNAYVNQDGALLQPRAVPGDVRFVDVNGDGVINDDDRTYIGKGIPDWTFGINLGFEFKGFDFSMLLQGQLGSQTFNVTRRPDLYYINLPKNILNRWTGEGTSDRYPRFTFQSENDNYRSSDLWVEDSSFLRARNIQLGYTLPQSLTQKAAISRLRVFFQVENAFTLTKYSGADPEVTGGNGFGTEVGIDRGVYPQSRTLSFGVNVNF